MKPKSNRQREFFFITFLWSWTLLSIPIMMNLSYENTMTKILFFAAGIAPSATGIILTYIRGDQGYWRDFWKRTLNFRQIGIKWYVIIFGIIPLTSAAAIFANCLFTKTEPDFGELQYYMRNPVQFILFAISMFLFGPVAEEIGWRGYALDHLEKRHHWFVSSMILGFFWSTWHLPMFFIGGTYQNDLMDRSFLLFVDFFIAIFAVSILMDWVYSNTGRSILSGVLLHFCINFFGELLKLPANAMYLRTTVQIAVAALILISRFRINRRMERGFPL